MFNEKSKKLIISLMPYLVFAVMTSILMLYQTSSHTTIIVGDGYFHFTRFYDAAAQIRNHIFSYFQMNWGFDRSGRIVNAVYGPFFAYFNGLLLIICKSWYRYQIVSGFIYTFLAGTGIYLVAKKLNSNMLISILIALMYMTEFTAWNVTSGFTSISAMLVPYIVLCAVKMLKDRDNPINWWQFGLTMSVVGQIHLMTTLLGTIALVPAVIVAFVRTTNRKKMLLNFFGAVGMTLVLTANVWLALVYTHTSEPIFNPIATDMAGSVISFKGYYVLFMALFVLQTIYVLFHFKQSAANTTLTLTAAGLMLLGSRYIPWGWIQVHFPTLREVFQLPRRLMTIAIPFMLAGIAISLNYILKKHALRQKIAIAGLLLVVLGNMSLTTRTSDFYIYTSSFNKPLLLLCRQPELSTLFYYKNVPAPDYLPMNKKIPTAKAAEIYDRDVIKHKSEVDHKVESNGSLTVTWTAKNSGNRQLPIVMYRHSHLTVNGNKAKIVKKNAIGVPTIKQKKGRNTATLSYQEPRGWTALLVTVIIGWILALGYGLWRFIRRNKELKES